MTPRSKVRADQLLVDLGLAESKTKAQALITLGKVYRDEVRIDKPGTLVPEGTTLSLRGIERYVSRGGIKLEGALRDLSVDPTGTRCLDIGASTGGFTDCLLQHGAAQVIAVDVGHGQLAQKLRNDARVVVLEKTNARHLEPADIGGLVDLVVIDASFIGLDKLLPAAHRLTVDGGELLALIKPQFEVGREEATRAGGVITDPVRRKAAIERCLEEVHAVGYEVLGHTDSQLAGPKGNVEAFVRAVKRVE
jgi:23S rRNA (cytidine1920-2'-O)/16S rRNA (cytidine1409-2'-O)-methyltransferase